ncbi:GyrI-like domain-containing protein [Vibrio rumoiensis]|uniref:AraC effector-binding domain-containing protein n=1 Tax=Vibrio rumoiensis 1S-45 TaxID=1188252 RepID=A0A1E5DZY3_9VIBR|nr:GyrI-like domain-containing protein [Vibrio rumoiensis]OEF23145.1 hypothetical protein A1QC_02760 [Vibrio rumoiensis 1S-45]
MKVKHIEAFQVKGITIRTNNQNEASPSSAQIGLLWHDFNEKVAPLMAPFSETYGVYTEYESDHTGDFDVIACTDTLSTQPTIELSSVNINRGQYAVFTASGPLPETVINLWMQVWQYFSDETCEHKRAFTTDFEHYEEGKVSVYIALEIE